MKYTEQTAADMQKSSACSSGAVRFDTEGVTVKRKIIADGSKAMGEEAKRFDGTGMISANNSSRLLLDYKALHPQIYQKLLEYLFGKDGLGLSLIKIEMGADVDSSSGTEPAVMRSADEAADVTRGAGYQLAADALKIAPDIRIDLIYWGIPAWVANAEDGYDAMYKWFKATIDAMYDTYGIRVTNVTVNQNERNIDCEWVKYFSRRLKEETDERYDYDTIKLVCGEEVGTWGIAPKMLEDEELREAIDVVSSHYTSWTTPCVKKLQEEYGKKVWFSEGSPPMSYAPAVSRYDGNGSGLSGINGTLDIATRITQAIAEGMTMYEFQPVVSAYYSGVTYYPKQLITANEPWSGAYSLDAGFYMVLHFSKFIRPGWRMLRGGCFGDGIAGGDGHAVVGSTFNYVTAVDSAGGNCSVILVNNSAETIGYDIEFSELSCADSRFYVWETRGPDEGADYYSSFFRKLGFVQPENGRASVVVKPYSMMTVSTLDVPEIKYESAESSVMRLPYSDDFEYTAYGEGFLASRGYAPLYTTDQGGAFEIENAGGNNVLVQKITEDIRPVEWGGSCEPVTILGDDRWSDISASIEVKLADDENAYAGLGIRYALADAYQSGYWIKLEHNGCCWLMKGSSAVTSAEIADLDTAVKHTISISAQGNTVRAGVDGREIICFNDTERQFVSGRAAIYSSYHKNSFDSLRLEAAGDTAPYMTRIDALDMELTYSAGSNCEDGAGWYHDTMCSFRNYNRTCSRGKAGDTLEFEFYGSSFAVIGNTVSAYIKAEADGEIVGEDIHCTGAHRQAAYYLSGLECGRHKVKLTVTDGILEVDAVEYK
ncbi:glycosyl hydrolase family 59 [Ruminococcus sp.]|uniref:glycosyl hydrolase family 59 n=1 Tax=Ruminococcus sp. TaxID=41978 RepID=UPI0025D13043|nr:glycosyl hydrolase family 59 [Ruminococcus sp.]MBQ8967263.1 glycosyl hydrolase family 59 [Ruminococcus sp.]